MTARHAVSWSAVLGITSWSIFLMGFAGGVDRDQARYRSVAKRDSRVTITGFADTHSGITICAYQQSVAGGALANPLGCGHPRVADAFPPDACGVTWYPFTLDVELLSNDDFWFRDNGPDYTRVLISRNVSGGTLFTATGDFDKGPSDASTCARSRLRDNASIQPLTFFNGSIPDDLQCNDSGYTRPGRSIKARGRGPFWPPPPFADGTPPSAQAEAALSRLKRQPPWGGEPVGSVNSFAGCPFTCNLPSGCDANYGNTKDEYSLTTFRTNSSGQDTSKTRYDRYGENTASGVPAGEWGYQLESGTCDGGFNDGNVCETDGECPAGSCDNGFTVMRRNDLTGPSINLRRGESRRNLRLGTFAKMKGSGSDNQQVGLVARFFDADNYFAFVVTEYPSDQARIVRYSSGAPATLAWGRPVLDLTRWTRLTFKIIDNGDFVNSGFVPDGSCQMSGSVNGSSGAAISSTPCGNAPYGNYGVFSNQSSSAQFFDLDADLCGPGATHKCYDN